MLLSEKLKFEPFGPGRSDSRWGLGSHSTTGTSQAGNQVANVSRIFLRSPIEVKSLSLTECGIELSTTSDEAAKLFDATVAQTVLMDTDKQGSCSVLVLPIVYLNSFERWAQLKMVHTSNDHL